LPKADAGNKQVSYTTNLFINSFAVKTAPTWERCSFHYYCRRQFIAESRRACESKEPNHLLAHNNSGHLLSESPVLAQSSMRNFPNEPAQKSPSDLSPIRARYYSSN